MDASPIISCSLNLFVKQVESLAHLCVDYESSKLRIEAWKVLNEMLTRLKNAEKGKLVTNSPETAIHNGSFNEFYYRLKLAFCYLHI